MPAAPKHLRRLQHPAQRQQRPSAFVPLLRRCTGVDELRDSRDQLRWREWLSQHDTVGNAFGRPIFGVRTAYIDDGEIRIDFSGTASNLPTIEPAQQIDISDKRPVFAPVANKQRDRFLARGGNGDFKTAFGKRVFKNNLDIGIVFNDQDRRQLLHRYTPIEPRPHPRSV